MVEYISRDSFLVAYQFLHLKGVSSLNSILATLPLSWPLPYLLDSMEEVLARLRSQLQADQPAALSQPQALIGLGGVGKTHVALEYAYRFADDYQAVFWVRADSRNALVAGFHQIAHTLNLPERDERDQNVVMTTVKGWLSQHTSWLLILDNVDELELLPEFLPAPFRGHLLLTTRTQALGRLANRIEIETLDPDIAALLVLRRAGLLEPDVPLTQAEQADRRAALQLSRDLGCLPLALDQAGAYLEETGCSLQQYLDLYCSHRSALLRYRGGVVQDHPDSVTITLALAFASVESRSPLAADVLRLCSVLHPDAIPEELFLQGATHLGPVLVALENDSLAFNEVLAVIQSYSLLRRASRQHTLSMHRLVQAVLADAMTNEMRDVWRERAIAALNAIFPAVREKGWGQWEQCNRLLPHVLTVTAANAIQENSLELASLLTRTADYLLQRTHYYQAESLYQRALSIREQMLGDFHPQVTFPLYGLADVYREQCRYELAEPLYQRALHLWEAYSQEYPEIPAPFNDLALLYHNQGNYQQAESLYQRALHFWETYNQEDPRLASPLNNLAILYSQQGQYERAEPLYQRALHICEQTFGQEHPEVASPLNGLANLYREQGQYERAESLYQRSLTIRYQQRGANHPETAESLHDFARLYELRNQQEQANTLYQQALVIREQRLGPEHPRTRDTRTCYARFLRTCGRSEKAAALMAGHSLLGETVLATAWSEGFAMTSKQVTAAERPVTKPSPSAKLSPTYPDRLTAREVEILCLVAQGLTDAHIAKRLIISMRTVNNHLTSIYSKIQVSSRSAATRYAFEHHLVESFSSSSVTPSHE